MIISALSDYDEKSVIVLCLWVPPCRAAIIAAQSLPVTTKDLGISKKRSFVRKR
jgi:hypothetical protein